MNNTHQDVSNIKRDKFDYAIMGIFICSIIVSFNHTIDLYKSSGFDVPIKLLNTLVGKWVGNDFFTLALFATIAAEAAFSVGLWGLFEAYKKERKFPKFVSYKSTWLMFYGGLVVIGWSNIGGTLGYDYLFGNPYKGYILGLSIPYFVLNAVLVSFSRTYLEEKTEKMDTIPRWKQLIKTAKEIKAEIVQPIEEKPPVKMVEIDSTEKENQPMELVEKTPIEVKESTSTSTKSSTSLQPIWKVESQPETDLKSTNISTTESTEASTNNSTTESTNTSTKIPTTESTKFQPLRLVENKSVINQKSTNDSTENQPTKTIEKQSSNKNKSTNSSTNKTTDRVAKLALKMYQKNGTLPTRTELMKKANCSQYQARKVLAELKQG